MPCEARVTCLVQINTRGGDTVSASCLGVLRVLKNARTN